MLRQRKKKKTKSQISIFSSPLCVCFVDAKSRFYNDAVHSINSLLFERFVEEASVK